MFFLDMLLDESEPPETNSCTFCGRSYYDDPLPDLSAEEYEMWESLPSCADLCPVCDKEEIKRLSGLPQHSLSFVSRKISPTLFDILL